MPNPEARPARVHGTLVEVAGVGVLLLGRSGIGKSECALELVMRGHHLVADDVVLVAAEGGVPFGSSPELIRHYMELRGIGIVHVPSLFGRSSVADRSRIELVVELAEWASADVERTGLDRKSLELAGFELAALTLPVAPGRNVASLVEVAARNFRLQQAGKSGAEDLESRVWASLRRDES